MRCWSSRVGRGCVLGRLLDDGDADSCVCVCWSAEGMAGQGEDRQRRQPYLLPFVAAPAMHCTCTHLHHKTCPSYFYRNGFGAPHRLLPFQCHPPLPSSRHSLQHGMQQSHGLPYAQVLSLPPRREHTIRVVTILVRKVLNTTRHGRI